MIPPEHISRDSRISISIVIHHQAPIVQQLLNDFRKYCSNEIEVLLTMNVQEDLPFSTGDFDFPLRLIINEKAKGFGTNHNNAFEKSAGNYFCIMNPDIRLKDNPFPSLIECVDKSNAGVVAPLIVDRQFKIEDSARLFPTPLKIIRKALRMDGGDDDTATAEQMNPDWVAGMFMLFLRERFKEVGGFNEKYFLYYEDVDLCARLALSGYQVILCPDVKAIHEAQRKSHENLKYLRWHISSAFRFFSSKVFFDAVIKRKAGRMQLIK